MGRGEYAERFGFSSSGHGTTPKFGVSPYRPCSTSHPQCLRELRPNWRIGKQCNNNPAQLRHLNEAAIENNTSKERIRNESINSVKFGVNGRTPGAVLNMFAARVSGAYI